MVIEQVHPRHRTLPRQKGGGRGDAGGYDEEAGWVLDVDDSTCAECHDNGTPASRAASRDARIPSRCARATLNARGIASSFGDSTRRAA